MSKYHYRNLHYLWFSLTLFILDQATKYWARVNLDGRVIHVFKGFSLRLAFNTGAAFSLLNNAGGWQQILFIVIAVGVVSYLVYWLLTLEGERCLALAMASIIGGGLGNVYDRVMFHRVTDFIDWYYGAYHWPTFNIADACVIVGIMFLLLSSLRQSSSST